MPTRLRPVLAAVLIVLWLPHFASRVHAATSDVHGKSALQYGHAHILPSTQGARSVGAVPASSIPIGPNMTYYGGPVMHTSHTYAIFWQPDGYAFESSTASDTSYRDLINRYFGDVGGSSLYNVLTQYGDAALPQNSSPVGASTVATDPFPQSGCAVGSMSVCLTDTQIQDEITVVMKAQGWTPGPGKLFFLFTPLKVTSCVDTRTCAFSYYCAYHSWYPQGGQNVIYANMPDAAAGSLGCEISDRKSPNSDLVADSEISIISHEHFEAVSDPLPNNDAGGNVIAPSAWLDVQGEEIGDKCAWQFGPISSDGSDVTMNGHPYLVQAEWDNSTLNCAVSYTGSTVSVPISKGWNLLGTPLTGQQSLTTLIAILDAQLGARVQATATYSNGRYSLFLPGFTADDQIMSRGQGFFVLSPVAGTWTAAGYPFTQGQNVSLNQGWNLVAAPFPSSGTSASVIAAQIGTSCSAVVGFSSVNGYTTWVPGGSMDIQIPAFSGIWVQSTSAVTWAQQ